MGIKLFLFCVGILKATVSGCPIGKEFITAFMPNYITNDGQAKPTLSITAQVSIANVTVEIKGLGYKQSLTIEKGSTKHVTLPDKAEIYEDGVSTKTVLITSDKDISVVSFHIKPFTGDSSVIFPSHQLGKSHVAFTPDAGYFNKIVAIINGKEDNTIDILPYSDLKLKNNIQLQRGLKMSIKLAPYQVYLLRSDKTLTGTRIESQLPVAVLAGHECLIYVGTCEHVYEQLVPIESLSDEYLVPPMHPLLTDQDTAHVVATEDGTDVTIYHGPSLQKKALRLGELLNVPINLATVIQSNKKIMVMYSSINHPYDEFLTNIIPVSQMSNTWTVYTQDNYQSFAVIVSEVESSQSLLSSLNSNVFPANKKYSWSIKSLGSQKGPVTISDRSPQAVYVYGGQVRHGYATTGVCNEPPIEPCESVKCPWREECRKGVCVKIDTAVCWAVGDPHYKTFDGKQYDFQGTCTYTMATTVKTGNGRVPFTILAKNNRRGSNLVSYVRTVSLNVYNHTIVASKQMGVVEVNGIITYLPVRLAQGKIEVVQSGWNAIITTDFGLEVKYDWNMMLYISAPSTYSGLLGGLCGNYNGDWTDEQSDPKGTKLSTVVEFAKSWKVSDNDWFCRDDCEGKCLVCPPELKEKYNEDSYCGLMAKTNGPFANCHKIVDPSVFIDNCVYDVCINKGIRSFLCDNMRTYAEACMAAGVKIDPKWRTLSECPLSCPANSHYEACGTACAASCADREAPSKCDKPCVEGCQCNTGFVLSGDQCVALAQCGCIYENTYYPPTDAFWGDQTCNKKCSCKSGQVNCTPTKCKASEVCKIQNGVRDCYPLSYGHCIGSGDPHYLNFDGRRFDFQGTCTYYLSKLFNTSDASLVPFEVLVKNENRGQNKVVSYTKTVEVNVFGYTIVMNKDNYGKVLVNNLFVNLPLEKGGGQLSIFRSGYFGVVKTDFGMTVRFNWDSYVEITLPSTYNNQVGGLCGNWNGNSNDDLTFPNKSITTNPTAFGNSWKARNDPDCSTECTGQNCPTCEAAERNKDVFTKPCSLITDTNGPFKACHSQINPTKFYEDCVYDMCMYAGNSTALCSALTAYTAACQTAHQIVEKWRTDSFCPASCKSNSHYDVCGAGCPQTCNGFTEPTACQRAPCIEGCVCDVGFVLSNSECVPMERCGCAHEGLYYNLDQVFYPKGMCSQRCVCVEQGKVTCKDNFSCGPNEQCEVRDGVQACHPTQPPIEPCESVKCPWREECRKGVCVKIDTAVCWAVGDPHYKTFDGKQYDFQGTCTYTMATTVKTGNGRVPFTILAKNNRRGSNLVSYVRTVSLNVYNHTIVASKQMGVVEVNGIITYLPVRLAQGKIEVVQSGWNAIITTDFGLEVKYDWNMMLYISAPSTYSGLLGGLCGNYNGDWTDEQSDPKGTKLSTVVEFAKSWKVSDNDWFCRDDCEGKCLVCPPELKEKYNEDSYCGLMAKTNGPFANCHKIVDPSVFIDNCVYDVCINKGIRSFLCDNMRTYAEACMAAGVKIDPKWRTLSECPLSCPANSHYEACGTACAASCADREAPSKCDKPCVEGCQCNTGFVLSGDQCVALAQCGCIYENTYYPPTDAFWGDQTCNKKCSCKSGQVNCTPTKCKASEVCKIQNGVRDCYPLSYGHCIGSGDPHYLTFDGRRFDFQGTCTYYLSKLFNTSDASLVPFEVLVKNENRGQNKVVSYTKTVEVNVFGYTIVMNKDNYGKVLVNNLFVNLPLEKGGGQLSIFRSGYFGVVKTDFGMTVRFNWDSYVEITLPSTFNNQVGGLCGNWNGNSNDDLTFPNKSITTNPTAFGNSWKARNDPDCSTECTGQNCPTCEAAERNKDVFTKPCSLITDTNGPFKACHSQINPTKFYEDCVYDMCMYAGNSTALCSALTAYTAACQTAHQIVEKWRTDSFCPASCKSNSHYDVCGAGCPQTCNGFTEPTACQRAPCIEGCVCDVGFVLSNSECVPMERCGCAHEGLYYNLDQVFYPKGMCSQRCVCVEQGKVTCKDNFSCGPNEQCEVRDGVQACHPTQPPIEPCESVKCPWREECRKGVCVKIDTAVCWAVGDPHYKTFDGKQYDFQGTCTYTMATTVKTGNGRVPFTILAKNNRRGSNLVSYVRTVSLNVYNHTIVASKQMGVVEVNGIITYLPVRLAQGKIEVVQSGWNAIITTDFGLEVKYDWNMMLYISAPSTYSGLLGGLCGNYNGDWTDEQSDPKGTKLSTVVEFAKSWKVSDNDWFCRDDCEGKCLVCPPELKEKYNEDSYCGLMAKTNGPFANCHKIVDPSVFIDNCVYDVCINKGIRSFLCDNMRTYAEACMAAGVKIDPNWRTLSECPLSCPANSHYEACGTACAASCADREAPSKCDKPCVEGCQCNTGFVLSGDQCVALAQCGCIYENTYYPPTDAFWGDQTCNKKCSCKSGQVNCTPTKCKASEVCKIQNGVRDCYPLSYGHCIGSGDPHYLTFDGRRFDFQGTCTYYLSKLFNTSDASLVPFEVLVKNENRGQNKVVSYTKTVEVNVFGYTIVMSKDNYGKVLVNNLFVNLPLEKGGGQLSIFRSGYFGVVKTDFGMTVRFNWDSYVEITLPSTYNNQVGGLCGNWNGNSNDDLTFPNKSITTNPTAFGNSWKARNDPDCSTECTGQNCPTCDAAERNKDVFTKPCSLITDTNGPFKACHSQINPTKFYEDCVYDMCMYAGNSTALCSALTAYTAACQTAHQIVEKWRTDSFCPASCKSNSHYDVCGAGCPQTCNGFTEPTACQRAPCIEGCVCDVGFVLSNSECVPMERCGCAHEGLYYNLDQVFYPKCMCSQRCVCVEQGKVTCKDNFSCGPNEQCEVRDGVQACHPDSKGSCSVSGSGTYHSYDGNHISVPGDCVYKLVETVQIVGLKKTPFSVTVQASSDVLFTRRIDIVIGQYKIALIPRLLSEIRVDDVKALLPVTLEGGLVKVYQSGAFIILETTFGLKVTYDTMSVATVEIPSTYKNAVRGLCGNYNDNKADDFLMPNGNQASSAEKFVEAWLVVKEGVICHIGCLPGKT